MAWMTPRTWVVGETLTAALLNTHLRDNLLDVDSRLDSLETDVDSLGTAPKLIAENTTESTTNNTGSFATLVSIGSLNIPATSGIMIKFSFRKTSGAAASAGILVQLNVSSAGVWIIGTATDNANSLGNGYAVFDIPPFLDNDYDDAAIGSSSFVNDAGTETHANADQSSPRSSAAVTTVLVQGVVSSSSITLGVQGVRVYEYPAAA